MNKNLIPMTLATYIMPFSFPLIGLVAAVIHIRWKRISGAEVIGTILMWQLGIGLGLGLMWGGFWHLVTPDRIAESIGWPAGNPFQREVGMWDISMGLVGLLCLKIRDTGFWTAALTGSGIFLFSAGLGHVYELIMHGNTAVNNAGGVMFMDLFYPIILAGLLVLYTREKHMAGL
jgi:hypothetical protein